MILVLVEAERSIRSVTGRRADMLRLGRYRHYKGKEYCIIAVAKHTETHEDFVFYQALYDNEISQLWVRPLTMFMEMVGVEGKRVPRFEYVGE